MKDTGNKVPGLSVIDEPDFPEPWKCRLRTSLAAWAQTGGHGRWPEWQALLCALPEASPSVITLDGDAVTIGSPSDLSAPVRKDIESGLRNLHPWRKGPFDLFGIHIDAEWRSDWKWRRLQEHIAPLGGRRILDVGCGNGYYAWRMVGAGAKLVVGIDPTLGHIAQFLAVKHYAGSFPVHLLPLGIEDVPPKLEAFDTVFSMGVLYHRRSPIDHLLELRGCMRSGGELVLETLVVEGSDDRVLVPEDRYAQMRNVWFIPSCGLLTIWLKRCGYRNIRVTNLCRTSVDEQRSTAWMRFQSLADFLDPDDDALTIEGFDAPVRAIIIAENP